MGRSYTSTSPLRLHRHVTRWPYIIQTIFNWHRKPHFPVITAATMCVLQLNPNNSSQNCTCWGASCSDTSHSRSEARGKCFSLNRRSNDRATPSADNTISETTSVPVRGSGCFDKSASEYSDASETDNPVKYLEM